MLTGSESHTWQLYPLHALALAPRYRLDGARAGLFVHQRKKINIVVKDMDKYRMSFVALLSYLHLRPFTKQPTVREVALRATYRVTPWGPAATHVFRFLLFL